MKKLIMWNVITLDGYFEGKQPWDLSFHEFVWGDELERLSIEQLDSASALVFGKATYEGMASYWKKEKSDIAVRMNSIRKYVCSKSLASADWNNTSIIKEAVAGVSALKEEGDGNLYLFGSAMLSNSLMKSDLFDEYRICIAPVFIGEGRLLFEKGLPNRQVSLLEAKGLSNGGVLLRYGRKS